MTLNTYCMSSIWPYVSHSRVWELSFRYFNGPGILHDVVSQEGKGMDNGGSTKQEKTCSRSGVVLLVTQRFSESG